MGSFNPTLAQPSFGINYGLTTTPTFTPSDSPLPPFGQMAEQKRDLLSQLSDITGKATDVLNIIKSPAGSRFQLQTTQSNLPSNTNLNFGQNSIFKNPLFIGGVALVAFMYFRK